MLQQILELYRGQGMEIYWRDNFTCPTEEDYKQMVIRSNTLLKSGLFDCLMLKNCVYRNWRTVYAGH